MKKTKAFWFAFFLLFTVVHAYAGPVPGTGQAKCYSNTGEIPCPSPGEAFYGQDAQHPGAGRSYTKLGRNGVELPGSATQADGWIMTRDNVTGLVWAIKTDAAGIQNKDNTYSWYDPDPETNGGNAGTPDGGNCTGSDCDTHSYIQTLNDQNYGGFTDWRMPSVKELSLLLNSGRFSPAIDTGWFPGAVSAEYWSSTSYLEEYAWRVDFERGVVQNDYKASGVMKLDYRVFAVRSGLEGTGGGLLVNDDGAVTDPDTGLMWQRETDAKTCTWEEAMAYAESLRLGGYDDWRLPDRNELQSLANYSFRNPAVDPLLAAGTESSRYWSSTTSAHDASRAWCVYFFSGSVFHYSKSDSRYVRAVRSIEMKPTTLSVVPASHDFGDVTVGTTSPARTFTITNTGGGSLVLGTIGLSGPDAPDFDVGNDSCSGQSLPASASCSVGVTFSPGSTGLKQASLVTPWGDIEVRKDLTGTGSAAGDILAGDINGDHLVDLKDLIIGLQIAIGMEPPDIHLTSDVDGDGRIGIPEALYVLRSLAEKGDVGDWSLIASRTVNTGGAILQAGPLQIDIPEGAFAEQTTLNIYRGQPNTGLDDDLFQGVGSPYRFEFGSPPQKPLAVTFAVAGTGYEGDPANLYVSSVEKVWAPSANAIINRRVPLETDIDQAAGTATTVVDFRGALDEPDTLTIQSDARNPQTDRGGFDFTIHLTVFSGVYAKSNNGLFRLWYNPSVTSNAYIQKIVADLTATKALLESYGFSFARRTGWPFDVYIKDLGSSVLGQFAPSAMGVNYSSLNIHKDESISDTDLKAICGHEFFHFLQSLYDPRSAYVAAITQGPYYWLSEASSVWFMAKIVGDPDYMPDLFIADSGFINEPLETNTESHGYGASGFLTYLTDKYGDGIMKEIWEKVRKQTIGNRGSTGALANVVANYGVLEDDWLDFAEKFITGTLPGHANWPLPPLSGGIWKITPEDTAKQYDITLTEMQAWHNMVGLTWGEGVPENAALSIRHPAGAPHEMKVRVFTQANASTPWVHHADLAAGGETTVAGFDTNPQKRVKVMVMNASASPRPGYFNSTISTSVELKFSVPQAYDFKKAELWVSYNAQRYDTNGPVSVESDHGPIDFWKTQATEHGAFVGSAWSSSWDTQEALGDRREWGGKTFTLNATGTMVTSFQATSYAEGDTYKYTLVITGRDIPRTAFGGYFMTFSVTGPEACDHFEVQEETVESSGRKYGWTRTGCEGPDSEITIQFYNPKY